MELTTKILINKNKEAAFEAFCDPDNIGNFWFSKCTARWQAGETVFLSYPEMGIFNISAKIIAATPGEKIVFTWGEGASERTVTITFTTVKNGTIVEVQEGPWPDNFNFEELLGTKEGWTFVLTCLKAWLESGVNTLRLGLFTQQ